MLKYKDNAWLWVMYMSKYIKASIHIYIYMCVYLHVLTYIKGCLPTHTYDIKKSKQINEH